MVVIRMRPAEGAGTVRGEGLYEAEFRLGPLPPRNLLRVRAKNARHAEEKMFFVFEHELRGKTLDFDLENFKEERNGMQGVPGKGEVPALPQEGR